MSEIEVAVSFRCSQEELAFLLAQQAVSTLAGFRGVPPEDEVEGNDTAVQAIIMRGLLAKGFAQPQPQGKVVIDQTLSKILSFCIYPQHVVTLVNRLENEAGMQMELYYVLEELAVRQYQPIRGVYDFTLVQSVPDFVSLISTRVAEIAPQPEIGQQGNWCLPQTAWRESQAHVAAKERSQAVFASAGLPGGVAEALAASLADPDLQLYVQVTSVGTAVTHQSLTLLLGVNHLWILSTPSPTAGQPASVAIQAAETETLIAQLTALFASLTPNNQP